MLRPKVGGVEKPAWAREPVVIARPDERLAELRERSAEAEKQYMSLIVAGSMKLLDTPEVRAAARARDEARDRVRAIELELNSGRRWAGGIKPCR